MLKRKATDFSCLVLAWVFVAAAGIFSQAAAADPDYLVEYKLHSEAMAKGDRTAAAKHAKAAWQAAEAALGDNKLTAILAFNYGRLIALADPTTALAPLRRAKELLDAGIGELPRSEVRVYLAYADYAAGKMSRRAGKELLEALLALETETGGPAVEDIVMWLELAVGELNKKRYTRATQAATKAEAAIALLAPDNINEMAKALLLKGVGTLVPYPRTLKDVLVADDSFHRATRLFPPQKDFDTFDPTLASVVAWRAATHAAIASMGRRHPEPSTDELEDWERPLFELSTGAPEDCGIEWAERKPPVYPTSAAYRGYIGAVMAVYDLGDDLIIQNPRILAEVPANTFSDAVLLSMQLWRLKSPPIDHPGCRKDIMTQFTFVLED